MNKNIFRNQFIWSIAALICAFTIVNLLPQPSMEGCSYAGPCHPKSIWLSASLFTFVCIILGPRNIRYHIFVLLVLVGWFTLEPLMTGELAFSTVWLVFSSLPHSYIFNGGLFGFICGHGVLVALEKTNNE